MIRSLLGATAVILTVMFAFVPTGAAKLQGPCQGAVAGHDVATLSSSDPAKAVHVGPAEMVAYSFSAPSAVTHYTAQASYGPYTGTVDEGKPAEGESTASGTVDVSQFSKFGVGVYRIEAHAALANGDECTAAFLLHVDGGVLSSKVGQASALLAVLAAGGVLAVSVTAGSAAKTVLVSLQAAL